MNPQMNHQMILEKPGAFFLDSKKFPPVQDPRDWAKSELQVRRKRWMQEAMQEAKVPSVLVANFLLVKQRVGKWKDDRE